MLVIRLAGKWTLKLDRQIGSSGKHGIWAFHCSESTFAPSSNDLRRTAAILPAEPKEGQTVDVSICDTAHSPDGSPSAQALRLTKRSADIQPNVKRTVGLLEKGREWPHGHSLLGLLHQLM